MLQGWFLTILSKTLVEAGYFGNVAGANKARCGFVSLVEAGYVGSVYSINDKKICYENYV